MLTALQFAYNEVSFMLVRLLQRFSGIRLRQDAHPKSTPPPGVGQSVRALVFLCLPVMPRVEVVEPLRMVS